MKPWARKQIEEAMKNEDRKKKRADASRSRKTPNVEFPVRRPSVRENEGPAFTTRVDISIISYRVRLADPDGISRKAAIDGLVKCNILANDSTKEIKSIRHRQVKVKNLSEEKTVIKIKEAT